MASDKAIELANARAEESEAWRRAQRLQITGASSQEVREALRHAQACRSRSFALGREMREATAKAERPQSHGDDGG